eukprot:TRINITY_DN8462_c0_g1_i1.p1 TRINITY_DN8462_c0_g1~~TRINITY_DN8462_c0_g1_i1.p1  ORF type:complete len:156 (+),score=69.85 TRINITY_DN8462_c0_g1_i1:44-469(+)
MSGQDWTEVVIRKKAVKPSGAGAAEVARRSGMDVETHKKYEGGTNKQGKGPAISAKKIEDEDGEVKIPKIDRAVSQAIVAARVKLELNQKELAVKINEPVKTITEYEQGKAIPNQQILSKLEKTLGVRLRGKDIGQPFEKK